MFIFPVLLIIPEAPDELLLSLMGLKWLKVAETYSNRWKNATVPLELWDILKKDLPLGVILFPLRYVIDWLLLFESLEDIEVFFSNLIALSLSYLEIETLVPWGVPWRPWRVRIRTSHSWDFTGPGDLVAGTVVPRLVTLATTGRVMSHSYGSACHW